MLNKIIIISLIFLLGVSYGTNLSLKNKIKSLTSIERIEYNNKIKEWVPVINIPEVKKPKNGWGNRY